MTGEQAIMAKELSVGEIVALCEKTSLKFKQKKEAIHTWQGIANVDVSKYNSADSSGKPEAIIKARIEFFVDRVRDARCFVVTTLEDRRVDASGQLIASECGIVGMIIVGDVVYQYRTRNFDANDTLEYLKQQIPGSTRENLIGDRAVSRGSLVVMQRGSGESNPEKYSLLENFDPFVWLQPRTVPMDSQYSTFADYARNYPDFLKRMVFEIQGSQFISRTTATGRMIPELQTFVVDMEKDFSVVSLQCEDPNTGIVLNGWVAEFEKQNDLFLPLNVVEVSERGTCVTKIEFTNSVINEPIPEKAFTLHHLGIRQEDSVYDNRTGSDSIVSDVNFPPALYKALLKQSRPQGYQVVRYLFITIGLVLVFTALLRMMIHRWQASRSGK